MKVALIAEWLDAWRGGAETSTGQFIHHLLDFGVELEVYTRSRVSPRPGMGMHTIRAPAPSRAFKTLAFCRAADEAVRRSGCDLVHAIVPSLAADVYQPRGGTCAETMARNLAVRRSGPARTLKKLSQRVNIKQWMLLGRERRMFTGSKPPLVIALSEYVVRQLQEHYDLPAERIRKVFNGVDADETDEAARARNRREVRRLYDVGDDDLLVLMVAHNFKLKGLRTWIDALTLLVRRAELPGLRSLVVGKDRVVRWHHLIERRGLGGVLQFAGATQRIEAFFHAADVLVHPTFYDPCSRVVLEGLASGLPCITTRFDGASEVVKDGVNGFVLEAPDDVSTLAEHVRRLADAETRRRMGAAARQVADQASMRRHTEGVLEVYRTICTGSNA